MIAPGRLAAVLRTDLRVRLRRPSALVLTAAAAVGAVLLIPNANSGQDLLQIAGARALYTSPTLAFATSCLWSILISFFGFYVAGHALGRDMRSRVVTVVAASPVTDAEYLAGKLLGSIALLGTVTLGFLGAAMAMQLLRGEGPLQPGVYLAHYAVLILPCIAWVSTLALLFECSPGLSGRLGDLIYLFVWALSIPLGVESWKRGGRVIGRMLDFTGLGFVVSQAERIAGTQNFTIGFSPRDMSKAPVLFPGLDFPPEVLLDRAMGLAAPLLLAPLALLFFRRFDPARTRRSPTAARLALPTWLQGLAGLLARPLFALLARPLPDAALTFRTRPVLALLIPVFAALGLVLPVESVRQVLLPLIFATLSLALADVATRERTTGLAAIVYAAPGLKERYALWKLGTALTSALLLAGVPVLRLLAEQPGAGLSALIGIAFLAAASVGLGIASGTPKAYMAVSLAIWYLALNARGRQSILDYGGWWGSATPAVQAGWLAATATAAGLALLAHRWRLARES